MGDSLPPGLDVQALREIDRACDRFEAAWRSGSRPSLDEHLGHVSGPDRRALARELVLVDVAWRRRSGDEPRAGDYARLEDLEASWLDALLVADTGRRLGRFELLERLGAGAFGAVWKARDTALGRLVALKTLHGVREASPEAMERFHREARAAARLSHPGIAAVHETTAIDGSLALVTELVEGRSLRTILGAGGMSAREAATVAAGIADALAYAHEMGVVHRDLKPANVVIDEARGRPVIVDFGLASLDGADASLTHDGEVLGTPAYMSPEQAGGRSADVDRRTDVYGLGAILYEMACGRPAFAGTAVEVLARVRGGDFAPPRTVAPDVPRDLETIILTAMALSPDARYADARRFAEDLRRFLDGEPIRARPESALDALRRLVRRHRLVVAAAAAFVVMLAAFSVAIGIGAARTRREAAVSASVARLLEGLFEASSPEESLGQDITARDLLSRGVARIEGDASLDPLVRARLLRILGSVLLDLGDEDSALRLQETALRLRREHLDAGDLAVAESESALARALLARKDLDAAESLARSALDARARALPEGDPALVASLHQMGEIANARKDPAAARAFFERSVASVEAARGPNDPLLLHDLSALSVAIARQGDYKAAAAIAERVLAIAESAHGPEHPEVAKALVLMSEAYRYTGRPEQAMAARERSIAMLERIYGEEHAWVRSGYRSRAELLERAGRKEDAERDYLKAVAATEKATGPDSLATASALNDLARFYLGFGRIPEVEPIYRRILAIRQAKLPADDPDVVAAAANLARQLARTGRSEEAEQILRRLLDEAERARGDDSVAFVQVARYLAGVLTDQGRAEEAMSLVRRISATWDETPPAKSAVLASAARQFGDTALRSGHHAEAIPFYELAVSSLRVRQDVDGADLAIALHEMAVCLRSVGCPDAAVRAFRDSLAIHERLGGPDGKDALSCAGNLAAALAGAGNVAEARDALKHVVAAQAKGFVPAPSAMGALARIAVAEGRAEEGEAIARQAAERAAPGTPQEASALLCLGEIALARNMPQEAEPILARAIQIRSAVGGPASPALRPFLEARIAALEALGRHDDAAALALQLGAVRAAAPPCPPAPA